MNRSKKQWWVAREGVQGEKRLMAYVVAREGATYTSHGEGREAEAWADGERAVRALTMPPFEDSPLVDSCDQRGLRVVTVPSELAGRQVTEGTVRALLVVVNAPGLDLGACILQG